jgi:hypothetical protein
MTKYIIQGKFLWQMNAFLVRTLAPWMSFASSLHQYTFSDLLIVHAFFCVISSATGSK